MSDARPDEVQVYRDDAGEWRWRRVAPNGEVIGDSGEGYGDRGYADDMARRVNGGHVVFAFLDPQDV